MARRSWGGWQAGRRGWGCGPRAVVGVEVPAVGAVGEAVCGFQTQWFRLQGRAVSGSRWHTQRGHAVAGGSRYLLTDGGSGACGLVSRAC